MRRAILFLTFGVLGTALLISLFSVYIFHDVDQDKVGHLGAAFAGLCAESFIFALIVGAPTGSFTALERFFFRVNDYAPRSMLGVLLEVSVSVCQ